MDWYQVAESDTEQTFQIHFSSDYPAWNCGLYFLAENVSLQYRCLNHSESDPANNGWVDAVCSCGDAWGYNVIHATYDSTYGVDADCSGIEVRLVSQNDSIPDSENKSVSVQFVALTSDLPYPYSPTAWAYWATFYDTSSAAGTIYDDDHWQVSVTATANTATERLADVAPDYGEYTFTRTLAGGNISGDTSYGVVVNFDMIYDNVAPTNLADNKLAMPSNSANVGDYRLQYLNANNQWTALSYGSSNTVGTVTRYHYAVTIPAGQTQAKVRLVPNFDWEDEAELFNPFGGGSAKNDVGEFANLEIISVNWNGKGTWDAVNHSQKTAQVEIKDGAILELYLDYDGNGTLDVEKSVLDKNCYIPHNDDDDNDNGIADKLETGGVFGEDELRKARLYAWVETPGNYTFNIYQNHQTAPKVVELWLDNEKINLLAATQQNPKRTQIGTVSSTTKTVYQDFYLEGILVAGGNLTANAEAFLGATRKSQFDGNESTYICDPVVDLDIDSDNNGYINDPIKNLARSIAEDEIEATTAKPITRFGAAAVVPADYQYVELRVAPTFCPPGTFYTFIYSENDLCIYSDFGNTPIASGTAIAGLGTTYYVAAKSGGNDGVQSIKLQLRSGTAVLKEDEVKVDVQQTPPDWIVPSGWKINGANSFTTPTPVSGAVGPKTEGSGVLANTGYAYSQNTYVAGFTMTFDYSFVGNSGIKLGSTAGASAGVTEIQILDVEAMVTLAGGIDAFLDHIKVHPTTKIPYVEKFSGYEREELSTLLPGIIYGTSTFANIYGVAAADTICGKISAGQDVTLADYRALFEQYYEKFGIQTGKMKVELTNVTTVGGVTKGKLTVSLWDTSTNTYIKTYEENNIAIQRQAAGNFVALNGHIYLQSHWRSGVTFSNLSIV